MPTLRSAVTLLLAAFLCLQSAAISRAAETVEVKLRLEQSALLSIPRPARERLEVKRDESPEAQVMIAAAPQQKAVPIFFIALGVAAIPVIYEAILEMRREMEYGGVIIDCRDKPCTITNSPKLPADFVQTVRPDGTTEKYEPQSFTRDVLRMILGEAGVRKS
jgi:hypothetical protein